MTIDDLIELAREVESLRNRVVGVSSYRDDLLSYLALNQLNGGALTLSPCPRDSWGQLRALIASGHIMFDNDGVIYLGETLLPLTTRGQLDEYYRRHFPKADNASHAHCEGAVQPVGVVQYGGTPTPPT